MNVAGLIEGIVRQTTVLIAQLATAAGSRAPLAQVADEVFMHLARELENQGVRKKVAADMFGLALRSYQKKLRRVSLSGTRAEQTLWEAVRSHVAASDGGLSRVAIFRAFHRDDPASVAAILADLVEHGALALREREGDEVYVRAAAARTEDLPYDSVLSLEVWRALDANPMTRKELERALEREPARLSQVVVQLLADGCITEDDAGRLRAALFTVSVGDSRGWEAAVLDHYSALAKAVAAKVSAPRSADADRVGGATYGFDLHPAHPHRQEVERLLGETRERIDAIFERVRAHNAEQPYTGADRFKVIFYFGQHVERP